MDVCSIRPQRPDSQTLSALVASTTSRLPPVGSASLHRSLDSYLSWMSPKSPFFAEPNRCHGLLRYDFAVIRCRI